MKKHLQIFSIVILALFSACTGGSKKSQNMKEMNGSTNSEEIRLVTLAPGHFHAALVQKSMYLNVSPVVHVYAPEGPEVQSYLNLIEGFNTRKENPTNWDEIVYTGNDFLTKMLNEKAGNVVVLAGNNKKKTEYIKTSLEAGYNVLADKPMVISPEKYPVLEKAFETAAGNNLLLYDIMTERYEITTILQRELSQRPEVFGELQKGTQDNPAIAQESVHRFSKRVAGKPLIRPAWFFDISQEGEGIVDVATHLVDLTMWEAFPGEIIKRENILIDRAKHWTTDLNPEQFSKVTGLDGFPEYLNKYIEDGILKVYSNGSIIYKINDVWAKVSVTWNFDEPKGGDTHYSIMRGTKCNLVIRQGAEQGYKPVLYVEPETDAGIPVTENEIRNAIENELAAKYPGVKLIKESDNRFYIDIPQKYKIGHEGHFRQVTERYLEYLQTGKLPAWEIPNMITKYYITTTALKMARGE
jgi:predicted dehydrogenase